MSAIDRRRRLGPANAIPLEFSPIIKTEESKTTALEKKEKLFVEISNIPTATGSSFIQSSSTLLLASVYGPRPSFKRTFNPNAVVKINFHKSPYLSKTSENKIIESVIISTLETSILNLINLQQYPKSTIDIFVNLINIDENITFIELLKLIHNSVNLAIIDSGISIKNFPTAGISDNVFVNCIHSSTYDSDKFKDLANENLLAFYIPKIEEDFDNEKIQLYLDNAIGDAKSLRNELQQFCYNKL